MKEMGEKMLKTGTSGSQEYHEGIGPGRDETKSQF